MARARRSKQPNNWNQMGIEAARGGEHELAVTYFERAIKLDRKNAGYRFNLAIAVMFLGRVDDAARELSVVLRHQPGNIDAARPLSRLLAKYQVSDHGSLEPFGLKAALGFDQIDRQPIVEAGFRHLRENGWLGEQIAAADDDGYDAVAEHLLAKRTADPLHGDLFLACLERGLNKDPDVERLLTALRRVMLLGLDAERFRDPALMRFAIALMGQCRAGEYVFAVSEGEREALAGLDLDLEAFCNGDADMARPFILHALYRPPEALLGDIGLDGCGRIKPRVLRDAVAVWCDEQRLERELADGIGRLCEISEPTSRAVKQQYEASPYPRWTCLQVMPEGAIRHALESYFEPDRLAFMDEPFDVLIAGAGTGRQAVQAAFGYGPKARIVALDLSRNSLAYARRMATHYGIENMTFIEGDLLDLARSDERFDVIECIGVLHHMAEPFKAWSGLLRSLKPEALLYIGLYSRLARDSLASLRREPGYPGAGCSDEAARAFRRTLMDRDPADPGGDLSRSGDFYSLSDFRDLALHTSEQTTTLAEIESFLAENRLTFRGFTIHAERTRQFTERFPDDPPPGTLANWSRFEQDHPTLFEAMYRFWCTRGG